MKNCDLVEKNTNIYITTGARTRNTRQTRVIRLKSIKRKQEEKNCYWFFLEKRIILLSNNKCYNKADK